MMNEERGSLIDETQIKEACGLTGDQVEDLLDHIRMDGLIKNVVNYEKIGMTPEELEKLARQCSLARSN